MSANVGSLWGWYESVFLCLNDQTGFCLFIKLLMHTAASAAISAQNDVTSWRMMMMMNYWLLFVQGRVVLVLLMYY